MLGVRDEWAAAFAELANGYWTDDRTRALTGGKQVPIVPRDAPVLLRALGLLHRDASMPPKQVRKYRQINHMVLALRPALEELAGTGAPLRLVDAGCGASYLSLLLAWCARHVWDWPLEILGVDRNDALIATCTERAALVGLSDTIRYAAGALDASPLTTRWSRAYAASPATLDAVVALHACDTATDDAIVAAVAADARFIAVAPCCQAELAQRWREATAPAGWRTVWEAPHLRRHAAATATDAMRVACLRALGYEVAAIEFVASEHTPKNTLIRAMRRGGRCTEATATLHALIAAHGGHAIALVDRLGLGSAG